MRAPRAFWLVPALALSVAALMGLGSCFYAPPAWFRRVEQMRLHPDERRLAMVMRSALTMQSRGLAAVPDGGGSITLRQVDDVWICDPQERIARRIATFPQPGWIGGDFSIWMIDWQSHGERSSLYLRVSGTQGRTSNTPRVVQHARVDFDRNTADQARVVYLDSPHIAGKPLRDFVNPPNSYEIMSLRRQGDTLLVWTDRSPDWRARFLIDRVRGRVAPLERVPRRSVPRVDSAHPGRLAYDIGCPDTIRGVPSPTDSRISVGAKGAPPVVTATIARVDVSCAQRRYPSVGSERDGEIYFSIDASAWINYEIRDPERYESSGGPFGATMIVEALSDSDVVLGSDTMGFVAHRGANSASLNLSIDGVKPEDVPRVARVVARWGRAGK